MKGLESVGAIPISEELRSRLRGLSETDARAEGWRVAKEAARRAGGGPRRHRPLGLRFGTVVGEAYDLWHAGH